MSAPMTFPLWAILLMLLAAVGMGYIRGFVDGLVFYEKRKGR